MAVAGVDEGPLRPLRIAAACVARRLQFDGPPVPFDEAAIALPGTQVYCAAVQFTPSGLNATRLAAGDLA